jgi:protein O-mannosyl-transferase
MMPINTKTETRRNIKTDNSLYPGYTSLLKRRDFIVPLIIILIFTALIYSRALHNEILNWDDNSHITYNPDIRSLSTQNIAKIFTSFYCEMYHPLVTLSFAVEYELFGLNPVAYHTTNVLFHLANVILAFYFVLCLCNRREVAIIAACLFGIHPMHVESVAWITEHKDVLYAFFYFIITLEEHSNYSSIRSFCN